MEQVKDGHWTPFNIRNPLVRTSTESEARPIVAQPKENNRNKQQQDPELGMRTVTNLIIIPLANFVEEALQSDTKITQENTVAKLKKV